MRKMCCGGLTVVILLTAFALLHGCAGTTSSSPAAAPAPPIDLPAPAVLKLVDYQALRIDLSAIGGTAAAAQTVKAAPPMGEGATVEHISFGPFMFDMFGNSIISPALSGLSEIDIPTVQNGVPTTQYSATVTFAASGYLNGTHSVRIDFAPFDYANSGAVEPCSGNAAVLPVCIRFWNDGVPFLAGVIEEPPVYAAGATTPETIGKGRFKLRAANFEAIDPSLQGPDVLFAYSYAQQAADPTSKEVEFFFQGVQPANPQGALPTFPFDVANMHTILTQEGPAATALKNMNISTHAEVAAELLSVDQGYIGQFVEAGGALPQAWSGSYFSSGTSGGTPYNPVPVDTHGQARGTY